MSRCSYSGFDFITIDPLRFILYPFFPARPIWGLGSYRYNVNGGTTNYVGRKGSITVGLPFSRRRSSRVLLLRQNTQGLMKKIPVIFLCWDDSSLLNLMRKRHGILGRSFCLPVKRDDSDWVWVIPLLSVWFFGRLGNSSLCRLHQKLRDYPVKTGPLGSDQSYSDFPTRVLLGHGGSRFIGNFYTSQFEYA